MKKISIVSFIVIIMDRISKMLAQKYLTLNVRKNIIPNFLDFTYTKNEGAAFSTFYGENLLLIFVSVLALVIIFYLLKKKQNVSKFDIINYGLLIGGIIGNFVDRLFLSYVIDFIDFNIFNMRFAIFNIADVAIVIGAILIIISEGSENNGDNSNTRRE